MLLSFLPLLKVWPNVLLMVSLLLLNLLGALDGRLLSGDMFFLQLLQLPGEEIMSFSWENRVFEDLGLLLIVCFCLCSCWVKTFEATYGWFLGPWNAGFPKF